MLDSVLQLLYDEDREMTFKQLETTKNKVQPLLYLNLVEEVKIKITKAFPKTPNGLRITKKGIMYLTSTANSEETNLKSQLNLTLKEITNLRKGVETQITEARATIDHLSKIEASLLILNQNAKISNTDSQLIEVSTKLNLEQLRNSYINNKGKGSPFAPIGVVIEEMMKLSGLSLADIKYEIQELHLQKKVLLRGGDSSESSQYKIRDKDGIEYAFLRVLY